MRLRLSDCLRSLHRHRKQQPQQQQEAQPHQQQGHADSTATCLNLRDTLVDSEAAEQQQHQTRTEQQQQQQRHSSSTIHSSSSQLAPAAAAPSSEASSTPPLSASMLARAVSHKGPSSPLGGPQGVPQPEGSLASSFQNQVSESLPAVSHFSVYFWGLNDCGQLLSRAPSGSSPRDARRGFPPASVAKLENKSICGCCLGLDRTWVWDSGHSVWGGGSNEGGCIDPDGEEIIARPRLSDGIRNVVCISAGEGHTIAILENGCMYPWHCVPTAKSPSDV